MYIVRCNKNNDTVLQVWAAVNPINQGTFADYVVCSSSEVSLSLPGNSLDLNLLH